ncbi:MAG: aminoacyl-histidine dipeptidase [Rikenellaceae bacterium]
MENIASLEPQIVWEIFDSITKVPRPSTKEEQIVAWLMAFATEHGLPVRSDSVGNVVITRPAAEGFESACRVTLQSHVDMVCEKDSDVEFNFERDAIRTRIVDGWVTAVGTTLGADCGIGMAAALAALIDPELKRGELEALFTVNEEIGLTGAKELGEGMITGKYLINLDSEEEGEICIGCAGGVDTVATFSFKEESAPKDFTYYRIDVSGLKGGHSGEDINKGRANANKLLARLLWECEAEYNMRLSYFHGGNLRNAIPRESYAVFGIPTRHIVEFTMSFDSFVESVSEEFAVSEPSLQMILSEMPQIDKVIDMEAQSGLLSSMLGVANGVIAMSMVMDNLVETSSNLASVRFSEGNTIVVATSQRSSRESGKVYAKNMVESVFALAGADVAHSDGYPGWTPNPESKLLDVICDCYRTQYGGAEPVVRAMHAGLECGLFLENFPDLDMVSFGPTMEGVHSPEERLNIESVGRFWILLKELLARV